MKKIKKLPDSELDIMLVIWEAGVPVSRAYIEKHVQKKRKLATTTVLTFLSRLIKKGFVSSEKQGNMNIYTAIICEQDYLNAESKSILKKLYGNSLTSFVASLYDGNAISDEQLEELQDFLKKEVRK